jgi:hydroxyacylglutathione hydrolase
MNIEPIALLRDNYAWLISAPHTDVSAVVDPGEAGPVLDRLHQRARALRWILLTHHHGDHTGGAADLAAAFPGVEVVCSQVDRHRVPCVTRSVDHGERVSVAGAEVSCLLVPGHTLGAVAYHVPAARALFTGDTLFTGGCGRLFEGTAEQMATSLLQLGRLPGDTRVFCGHEYTEKNLSFAVQVEPDNPAVQQRAADVRARRREGLPTVPSTIATELATNPFLRAASGALVGQAGSPTAIALFADLRARRDGF